MRENKNNFRAETGEKISTLSLTKILLVLLKKTVRYTNIASTDTFSSPHFVMHYIWESIHILTKNVWVNGSTRHNGVLYTT